MKNFIFACIAVLILVAVTAVSSVTVGNYSDETAALIKAGEYRAAHNLFEQKENMLSLTVGGGDLRRLEESLIDLINGQAGAKEKALSLCEELRSRQRMGIKTLF